MLTTCQRKQHRDTLEVVCCCFLEAFGLSRLNTAQAKSPSAISRFLNEYDWSTRKLIRVMREHALSVFHDFLFRRRGRPPMIELIVDTTSIAKEGEFAELDGWIHTLNEVRGLHVVMLYLCCGDLRLPWSFKIWRGKGMPSPQDLALYLIKQLPQRIFTLLKRIHVLGDAGFSSKQLLNGLHQMGLAFTVGIRCDRKTTEGQKLREITRQERPVELMDLDGLKLWVYWIWLPAVKNGKPQQRFIVTNQQRTPATVHKMGRRRWKIKALFKTLKSRFAFAKFGQKTKLGVLRYLCLSLAAFLLCHLEQIDTQQSGKVATS